MSYAYSKHSGQFLVLLCIFAAAVLIWRFTSIFTDYRVFRQKDFLLTLNDLSAQIPFEDIHEDDEFDEFANVLKAMPKAPYLILYDSSNIDVVLNHICNLQFIPNTLQRLVAVAFDEKSEMILRKNYPEVPNVLINLKPILDSMDPKKQNRGYLVYTLALVVHAKICASLAARGIDFWSMHQDTLWTQNFDMMNVEDRYPDANMLFDTIGNENPLYHRMRDWVCGATFFVRGNPTTFQFFRQLESYMLSYQSPDSSIMTYLCGHHHYKCEFLPQWMVSSFNYFEGPRDNVPVLIQLDGGKRPGESKIDVLKRGHFVFRHENGTCNERSFHKLRDYVKYGFPDAIQKDGSLKENWYSKTIYFFKNLFNIDPWNRKFYLTIHQSLI
ncbi:unnamed protein product [Caenorhabditis nigoni]